MIVFRTPPPFRLFDFLLAELEDSYSPSIEATFPILIKGPYVQVRLSQNFLFTNGMSPNGRLLVIVTFTGRGSGVTQELNL